MDARNYRFELTILQVLKKTWPWQIIEFTTISKLVEQNVFVTDQWFMRYPSYGMSWYNNMVTLTLWFALSFSTTHLHKCLTFDLEHTGVLACYGRS